MSVEDVRTKRITLNIDPVEARDLLKRVPRACAAFVDTDGPRVEPVAVRCTDDRYTIGIPPSVARRIADDAEVVLLIDEGVQFFDLRAIYLRGHVHPRDVAASGDDDDSVWVRLHPTRIVAWDYARIREVDGDS
jgi:hypothetical protein